VPQKTGIVYISQCIAVLIGGSMAQAGREHLETAETVLKEAGFATSQPCISRPSCFDFAARREENLILLKIQHDVGNLTLNDSQELREISRHFSAICILVGDEARERPLEDDTIYRRYNIFAINPKTFENVALRNVRPLIQASPGGYYVEVDGEALKQRRQELGLSVGEVAEMGGTSRRTIYGYERGLAKASVPVAYNLVHALGIPVAKSVDIFQQPVLQHESCLLNTARRVFAKNKVLNRIFRKLAPLHVTTVKKAPFDFVIFIPEQNIRIIGGVTNAKEPQMDARIDEILSVSKVVKARPLLITEGPPPSEDNVPWMSCEDFSRIKSPEDLIANVK
jgi:putative transcriptional regulator